jgi:prevent-host-death family protein
LVITLEACDVAGQGNVAQRSVRCYVWPMSKIIAQRELRNDNAKVMDAVAAGETFVVTRNGEPVAELRPIRTGRRTFIARDEVVRLAAANVRIDHRRFREDLDERIDQGL